MYKTKRIHKIKTKNLFYEYSSELKQVIGHYI